MDSYNKDNDDNQEFELESTNVEDRVDFGPVYRCLHIHSVLGDRHEFEKCYRTQRKGQCMILLTKAKQVGLMISGTQVIFGKVRLLEFHLLNSIYISNSKCIFNLTSLLLVSFEIDNS